MSEVDTEIKIGLFRKMIEIRCFEEASLPYFKKPGHGSHHPCIGQEAIDSAIGGVSKDEDYLFGSHRSHGLLLARGLEPRRMMAELWGKTTGYCQGRGGSMHVTDVSRHIMVSGMVGTSITLAVGAGLALHLRGEEGVAFAVFGDGAANCGAFHEGLNMAAVWGLPVVFVCINNGLAVTTHMKDSTSVKRVADRAESYSMPGRDVDGTDPIASYEAVRAAADRARHESTPSLIEALVPRWKGHSAWEEGVYLTELEHEEMQHRDPLPRYSKRLQEEGVLSPSVHAAIEEEMKAVMGEAIEYAESSPSPIASKAEAAKFSLATWE
jgi:TPP-dependent pyruvate/acetoin dehydrogenase alpha subunit